jgi:alanyl-tRNA synthetase
MSEKQTTGEEKEAELVEKVAGLKETRRLYYADPYLKEFEAEVIQVLDGRYVILDQTAFYAEGGGQVSDVGVLYKDSEELRVLDVKSVDGVLLHDVKEPLVKPGDKIRGIIDRNRRMSLMRGHTATHIVLGAARRVLGEHAWQAGASKTVERSRLDISHYSKLTREQIERIEELSNKVVREGRPVNCVFMQRDKAEEKYGFRLYQGGVVPGKEIRVVDMGDWDVEACGGTHLSNTSEAGLIKIVATERVQDGIERLIYAVGPHALAEVQRREVILSKTAELMGSPVDEVTETIANSLNTMKDLRREIEQLRAENSMNIAENLLEKSDTLDGDGELIVNLVDKNTEMLIEVGNALKQKKEHFVAVLHSSIEPRLVVVSSDEATRRGYHAGKITKKVSRIIGGGGGGKPHLGQGGGSDIEKFNTNKNEIKKVVRSFRT